MTDAVAGSRISITLLFPLAFLSIQGGLHSTLIRKTFPEGQAAEGNMDGTVASGKVTYLGYAQTHTYTHVSSRVQLTGDT